MTPAPAAVAREVQLEIVTYHLDGVAWYQAIWRDPFGRAVYCSIKTYRDRALRLARAFLRRAGGRYAPVAC